MKYRKFGKLDWDVSSLGFGAMRLPIVDQDQGKIDEPLAIEMIRHAIDDGVNYIDTAYPYHRGMSEVLVGKALQDGYRDKVKLATKLPTWLVHSHDDMDRIFTEQLSRLQSEYVDFYLLHGLGVERWKAMEELKVFDWLDGVMSAGKVRYLGFSFHDEFDVFTTIVDAYDRWTFCQIHLNYLDEDYQAGIRGLRYAASKGLAVVIMEPIAGGLLAVTPPPEIEAIWSNATIRRTPAEWALRWVWNHPEVSVVLSGMSAMAQVVENLESASTSGVETLSEAELQLISQVRAKYREYGVIGCTSCQYCVPCPNGVDIPTIFALYNEYFMEHRGQSVVDRYQGRVLPENGAKNCVKCGQCEEQCPQHLPIRTLLGRAAFLFESSR
jgi:predicted aldo/keto reductase-like oxidoreductase